MIQNTNTLYRRSETRTGWCVSNKRCDRMAEWGIGQILLKRCCQTLKPSVVTSVRIVATLDFSRSPHPVITTSVKTPSGGVPYHARLMLLSYFNDYLFLKVTEITNYFISYIQHPPPPQHKNGNWFCQHSLYWSAFLTVTPSTALVVAGILFIMAPNEGESTVFKCSISSTTYRPTSFFNSPPLTCFAPKSSFCCLSSGGPPAEVEAVAVLAALCSTPPGETCSVNLTVLRCDSKCFFTFDVVFLKLDSTLSPAQRVQRTLIFSSLADTNSKWLRRCCLCRCVVYMSHKWHHSPRHKRKVKIYILTKENDKNNSNS